MAEAVLYVVVFGAVVWLTARSRRGDVDRELAQFRERFPELSAEPADAERLRARLAATARWHVVAVVVGYALIAYPVIVLDQSATVWAVATFPLLWCAGAAVGYLAALPRADGTRVTTLTQRRLTGYLAPAEILTPIVALVVPGVVLSRSRLQPWGEWAGEEKFAIILTAVGLLLAAALMLVLIPVVRRPAVAGSATAVLIDEELRRRTLRSLVVAAVLALGQGAIAQAVLKAGGDRALLGWPMITGLVALILGLLLVILVVSRGARHSVTSDAHLPRTRA